MNQFAPQPQGYPCNDPDFSKPLPGEVTHWDGPRRRITSKLPADKAADPWDKASLKAPCPTSKIPPVPVLRGNGDKPRPSFF